MIDLHLGPLRAEGHNILRSGVRWLCESGQYCRPNEVFAYCNITLEPVKSRLSGPPPFAEELELQIAFAVAHRRPDHDQRVRRTRRLSERPHRRCLGCETVIASIDPDPERG